MDEWESQDTFIMSFDGINVTKANLGAEKALWTIDDCGESSSTDTTFYDVIGNVPHSASSITIKLFGKLSKTADKASIGYRRFSMQFVNRTAYDAVNSYCIQSYYYSSPPTGSCPCTTYQNYWDTGTQSCKSCHSSCALCSGPTEYDCYKCIGGYALYDGKCSPCAANCFDCFGPNANQCNSCSNSMYIFPDNTCSSACPAERQSNSGQLYCKSSCSASQYMLANQTCIDSCDSPMVKKSSIIGNLCLNPCDDSDLFIYYDGTCSSTCDTPLVPTITSLSKACNPPCPRLQDYYYKDTGKCKSTCDFGYEVQKVSPVLYCVSLFNQTFSPADIASAQQVASTITAGGQATGTAMKAMSSVNSGSPSFAFLVGLSQMVQFIKYIDITYPPKVQLLLLAQGSNPMSLSFGINMPNSLEKKFTNYTLPAVFERYKVGSNFLVNYWNSLISLSLIILGVGLLMLTASCTKKYKTINFISSKLLSIFKWDLLLMLFCSSIGDLTFYSYLDFQSNKFESAASVISFLFALGFNVCFVLLLIKTLKIAYYSHKNKNKISSESVTSNPILDLDSFQFLYIDFHNQSFSQLAFMFYFLCRVYLFNIIIATLTIFPLMQCLLITGLTILMLLYLIIKRPMKKKWDLIYLIINELIILIIDISVLMIAMSSAQDPNNPNRSDENLSLQRVIITCNMIFSFLALASVAVQVTLIVIQVIRIRNKLKARGVKSIRQMILTTITGKGLKEDGAKSSSAEMTETRIHPVTTTESPEFIPMSKRKMLKIKRGNEKTKRQASSEAKPSEDDFGISQISLDNRQHSRFGFQNNNLIEISEKNQNEESSYQDSARELRRSQHVNTSRHVLINQNLTLQTDLNETQIHK